jgi:hypothetical protein
MQRPPIQCIATGKVLTRLLSRSPLPPSSFDTATLLQLSDFK